MTLFKKPVVVIALAALVSAFHAQPAAALTFYLDTGNTAISGYAGPYTQVDVTLVDSTHATITFTSLVQGGNEYLLGDGGSVAVNVNAASWTLGTISGSNAGTGFTPGPYSDGGAGSEDGWGSFNQTINSFDGYTHSSDLISFALTNTSGTWASDSVVLTANSDGYVAAAHIFVTSSPADAANGALATGFATGNGTNVPDGGMTMTLLGLALGGLGFIHRRK